MASVILAVPPARTLAALAPPAVIVYGTAPTRDGRGSDPPDTPPPIFSS